MSALDHQDTGPGNTVPDNPYDLLGDDHDDGAWVREAALAHAAKHQDQHSERAPVSREGADSD